MNTNKGLENKKGETERGGAVGGERLNLMILRLRRQTKTRFCF